MEKIVRIGGASGFWGDSALGAPQLVNGQTPEGHGIDYLVFDYLAELTMSLLVNAKAKDPAFGYATDFVDVAMKSVLKQVATRGIKVIANAGGVNPQACAAALKKLCDEQGVQLKIGVVEGDDVLSSIPALRAAGATEMFSGTAMPEKVLSANAYLGAVPIAAALKAGADVVITGRVVDSAVTLGALMHAFDWRAHELDNMAQGSLGGHILECGAQATGGLFTDWESVPDWANIGYPILECSSDGSFVVTKPANTGGLVSVPVVAEQMLYEIADPAAYILPDVVCDFTAVRMEQLGENRVRVSGARGKPPTTTYKVSATYMEGWRVTALLMITGIDAHKKARRTGEAILERTRAMLTRLKLADYLETRLEVLGEEGQYGVHANPVKPREAIMRLSARHENSKALSLFAREISPAGTSWSPGTTGVSGGRVKPAPNVRLFSLALPKSAVTISVLVDGVAVALPEEAPPADFFKPYAMEQYDQIASSGSSQTEVTVPLVRIAHARSGDKGNLSNVGVIAREVRYLPVLSRQLNPEAVKNYLSHFVKGTVTRHDVPGINAFNFVLTEALDGGGMASLRCDPLGKGMGQILLDMPMRVPAELLR